MEALRQMEMQVREGWNSRFRPAAARNGNGRAARRLQQLYEPHGGHGNGSYGGHGHGHGWHGWNEQPWHGHGHGQGWIWNGEKLYLNILSKKTVQGVKDGIPEMGGSGDNFAF